MASEELNKPQREIDRMTDRLEHQKIARDRSETVTGTLTRRKYSKVDLCLAGLLAIQIASAGAPASGQTQTKNQAHSFASAWDLYQKNRFNEAADAFESVLKTTSPSARIYYHAALANFRANRRARARQLCTHIVTYSSNSPESAYCLKLFPELSKVLEAKKAEKAKLASAATGDKKAAEAKSESKAETEGDLNEKNLPPDFWASLPKDLREKLKTPAGKAALKGALKDYNKRMAAKNRATARKVASAAAVIKVDKDGIVEKEEDSKEASFTIDNTLTRGAFAFTAAQIAKDGANGIDQNINPNCWFEASMAALAELPRGQRLLATMIRYGGKDTYIVRFPGDGIEYKITRERMEQLGINDRSLWASIIETAQVMKFPGNAGANGESGMESRLAIGLGCITGCKAEIRHPANCSEQELSSFIGGAVSSKNPIVCGSWPASYIAHLPYIVVPQHAYTIIGFDPASKLITIRNPHGKNSTTFFLADDPNHHKFEMKEDGVFKIHLSLFKVYFNQVCRSFI